MVKRVIVCTEGVQSTAETMSSPPSPLSAADVLADLADLSREDDGASQAIVPATLVGDLAAVAPELANNLLPHFHAMEQFSRELGGVALMSAVVRSCLLGEALEQHASCASVAGGSGPDLGMRELLTDSAVADMRRERERVTSRLKASVAAPWAGMRRLGGSGGGANPMPSYMPSAACKALAAEASSLRDRVAKASDLDAWERAFLGEAAGASSSASSLSASKDEDVDEDTKGAKGAKGGERKSSGSGTSTPITTSRSIPAFWARLEREGGSGAGATAEDDGALLVINDDDARALTQDSKDVERDQVEVNSELVKGSSGYCAVVRALETAVTEARKSPGAGCWVDRLEAADAGEAGEGGDRGGVIRRFARSVLRAGNRTQSGGDTLDTLCELAVPARGGEDACEDVVLLVPDSSRFAPIRVTVDIGPFEVKAPERSEGPGGATGKHPTRRSWHWGARATVQVRWLNGLETEWTHVCSDTSSYLLSYCTS